MCVCVICTITWPPKRPRKTTKKARAHTIVIHSLGRLGEKHVPYIVVCIVLCRYRGGPGFTITLLSGGAVMITYHSACLSFLTDSYGMGEGGEGLGLGVRQDQSRVIAYLRAVRDWEEGGLLRSEGIVACPRFSV